jgi:hypothetical protein
MDETKLGQWTYALAIVSLVDSFGKGEKFQSRISLGSSPIYVLPTIYRLTWADYVYMHYF